MYEFSQIPFIPFLSHSSEITGETIPKRNSPLLLLVMRLRRRRREREERRLERANFKIFESFSAYKDTAARSEAVKRRKWKSIWIRGSLILLPPSQNECALCVCVFGESTFTGTPKLVKENKNIMTYSSAVSVNRQKYTVRNNNVVSFKKTTKRLGPVTNTITVLVMVCLIGLVYLTQVTNTNSFSYEINALNQAQSQLKEEQKDLELTAARLRSVDSSRISSASSQLVDSTPSGTISN